MIQNTLINNILCKTTGFTDDPETIQLFDNILERQAFTVEHSNGIMFSDTYWDKHNFIQQFP